MNRYETHLTLADGDAEVTERLRQWAVENRLKWTHILLQAGKSPSQPMITFWGSGSIADQRRRANEVANEVALRGGRVVRVKIEANLENDEVPVSESEGQSEPNRYFEHHIKVLFSDIFELNALGQRVVECDARVSQNIRRQRADGRYERFITQRVYCHGRVQAKSRLDRLLSLLRNGELHVMEIEEEYVVFDSNIDTDSGWFGPIKGSPHDAVGFPE